MMLADSAQAVGGKLYILGGGWTASYGNPIAPHAVALIISVPWNRTNQKHSFTLSLVTEDGRDEMDEVGKIGAEGQFEVGRPAGAISGSPQPTSLAVNLPPLPLPEGGYCWRLEINGAEAGLLPFTVTHQPKPQ